MGVRARIVVYAENEKTAADGCRAAFDRIAQLEDIMSDYRADSELMRLNAKSGGGPVEVSPELLNILVQCQEMSRQSEGAFDVTVGPLVKLWRKTRKSGVMPSTQELDAARRLVGWRNIAIDEKKRTVTLAMAGMQLDLGGIAKGYACDEALRVLRKHGIRSALIEMGGDMVLGEPPPNTQGWQIELANAPDPQCRCLVLSNKAISSSGDTEQYVEIDGVRYSHIVDPRTGLGLTNRTAVTVIAPIATLADALSTAISVMGKDKGQALVHRYYAASAYIREIRD